MKISRIGSQIVAALMGVAILVMAISIAARKAAPVASIALGEVPLTSADAEARYKKAHPDKVKVVPSADPLLITDPDAWGYVEPQKLQNSEATSRTTLLPGFSVTK